MSSDTTNLPIREIHEIDYEIDIEPQAANAEPQAAYVEPQAAYVEPQATNVEQRYDEAEGEHTRDIPAEKPRDYSTYVCHNCKRTGHIKKDCNKPRSRNKKYNSNRVVKPIINIKSVNHLNMHNAGQ